MMLLPELDSWLSEDAELLGTVMTSTMGSEQRPAWVLDAAAFTAIAALVVSRALGIATSLAEWGLSRRILGRCSEAPR